MEPSPLQRTLAGPRAPRVIYLAGLSAAVFGWGIVAGLLASNVRDGESISVVSWPQIIVVAAPAVPTAPAPIIHVAVPPPVPPEESEPLVELVELAPAPGPPRAMRPHVWADCAMPESMADADVAVCAWDDGFPALSADGAMIATKVIPDDGGRGNPGLYVQLHDARTGKLARTIDILDPNEYVVEQGDNAPEVRALRERVKTRVAAAQRVLDRGAFRTMTYLGGDAMAESTSEDDPPPHVGDAIYAEVVGPAARIIDPSTQRVLWQHTFGVPAPRPITDDDDDDMCPAWTLHDVQLWWDEPTGVVVSALGYRTGGCLCSDDSVVQVARVPR